MSILLGKRAMTSNDFREDGWQKTKMRKLEHWRGMGGREVVSARPLPQLLVACW